MLLLSCLLVLIAFFIVVKGADIFVLGASSIAEKLGVSPFVVGLTIVAIGTSAPELFVNVIAAYQGATALSIGNIIGSNIVNILLGLGIAAAIAPLTIKQQTVWKEIPFALLSGFVILFVGADLLFDPGTSSIITRSDGLIMLSFFIIFIVYTFGLSKVKGEENTQTEIYSWTRSTLYVLGGLVALVLGGQMVVENAVSIANALGMSQNLIGLTIVAIGTSLPEIVTSIVAVRKGLADLVVGGIIGSIIFNVFFILGTTALVAPLPFTSDNMIDVGVLIVVNLIFFFAMFTGKKHDLDRWQGFLFVALYVLYISYAIFRG